MRLLPTLAFLAVAHVALVAQAQEPAAKPLRCGIIGLDTSHVIAFTTTLNTKNLPEFAGVRIVAAYPQGSKDIPGSVSRVPDYTAKVQAMGVEIVDSVEALVSKVDAVFLESNDGRPHLEQLRPCLAAKKPVFIDKPIAATLADTLRIFAEAKAAGVPIFCSSSLRFSKSTQAVAQGSVGKVKHAETSSPASLDPHHVDLYWYGVHGCESLYTVMGTGCRSVKRGTTADGMIEVTGDWGDGRDGIFRESKKYGGLAKGDQGEAAIGSYDSYDVLLSAVVKFFRTGKAPVSAEETTELYTFMAAADDSKRAAGAEVKLADVLAKAQAEVAK
jgi:hypothetical protein